MNIEEVIQTKNLPLARKTTINLLYTGNWASDKLSDSLKTAALSIQQFNVLRILRGQRGKPANLSTLQERMVSKMSNTTRLVDKLEIKELVSRITCPSNRRKIEITITDKGLYTLKKLDPVMDEAEQSVIANLSPIEAKSLNDLLNKMRS